MRIYLFIITLLFLPLTAKAQTLDIILARETERFEIFFKLPVKQAEAWLDVQQDLLKDLETGLNQSELQRGTWNLGDALLSHLKITINGESAIFETMSLMVHPSDLPLVFETPHDGYTAISVCGIPPSEGIEDLTIYTGVIIHPAQSDGSVEITFPNTQPMTVHLRAFDRLTFEQEKTEALQANASVRLDSQKTCAFCWIWDQF